MQEQNGTIWVDGRQENWADVRLPLMSDALLRGLSAFDGMVARRQPGGGLALLAPGRHLRRLQRTCAVLNLPLEEEYEQLLKGCLVAAGIEAEGHPECEVYVRPMVVGARLTERASAASVTVAAFRQPPAGADPAPVTLTTSSWRRPSGDSMPPSLKVVGNYQLTRLARLEAKEAGFDDALLLNSAGRVAEGAGAAIVMERDGRLVTPPVWEDCLDSVTIALLETLAAAEGIPFERAPVLRTDALSADGMVLAGTLADLVPVRRLDHREFGLEPPLLTRLRHRYLAASRGGEGSAALELVDVG
ncbi:aminotransferase class IV [Streptomyces sp. NPDC001985]|uniref:aminotransferase class IV n=1 Tax=Streptomyces sp. NPDC001985 TaxID=3154406 RepID=UPI00332DFF39